MNRDHLPVQLLQSQKNEIANEVTKFLDEIEKMPKEIAVNSSSPQDQTYERVCGIKTINVDVSNSQRQS